MSVRGHRCSGILSFFLASFLIAAPALAAPEEARQAYRDAVKAAMQSDKSISEQDRLALNQQGSVLGLSDDEAQEIEQQVRTE
ncbi:MAG: hypothetical protein ACREKF_02175 [Candidatus Methylomirabilales bacterium]